MNISCAGSCVQCAYCILCLIWAIWFKCVSFWDRLCKLYKSLWQIKYGKIIDCYQSIAINKEWSNVPNLLKLLTINFIMKKNQENPWFNKWCFFSLTKRNNILIDANTMNTLCPIFTVIKLRSAQLKTITMPGPWALSDLLGWCGLVGCGIIGPKWRGCHE